MKIGIFLPNYIFSRYGGGFSYVESLIENILRLKTHHVFVPVVLVDRKVDITNFPLCREIIKDFNPIIYKPKFLYGKFRFRLARKFCRGIGLKVFSEKFKELNRKSILRNRYLDQVKLDKRLLENEVQLLFYPLPCERFHSNFPFFSTVWDLGHRMIPGLPEIYNCGHFDYREEICSDVLPKSSKIIVESEQGKKELLKFYSVRKENVCVVPMFPGKVVDMQIKTEEELDILNKFDLKAGTYFIYPAQFWAHKNHFGLLNGLKILKEKGKNLKIILTGSDKGNYDHIKELIESLDLKENVFYLGFVSQLELKALYLNAISLIMPTILGPTNMPLLEAALCGCPVLCSDLPGHREQLGNLAIYFNPRDFDDIAHKIEEVLNPDVRERLIISMKRDLPKSGEFYVKKSINKLIEEFDDFEKFRKLWN